MSSVASVLAIVFVVLSECSLSWNDANSVHRAKRYYDFTLTLPVPGPAKTVNVNGKHPLVTLIELIPWAVSGFPMDRFPLWPQNTLNFIPRPHFSSR